MKFFAIYRCSLCEQKFRITDEPFEIDRNKGPELVAKILQNQSMIGNPYLYKAPMNIPHNCKNGGIGIAYLIGFKPI